MIRRLKMKYWDVHIEGERGYMGYSVAVKAPNAKRAAEKAYKDGLIGEGDYKFIDYAKEITRKEYVKLRGN